METSASASEIFAMIYRIGIREAEDYGAKYFRQRSSVQRLIPLSNGNGIKITTAYYYIKSGRCIHKMSNDKILKGKEVSEEDLKKKVKSTSNRSIILLITVRSMEEEEFNLILL